MISISKIQTDQVIDSGLVPLEKVAAFTTADVEDVEIVEKVGVWNFINL